MPTSVGLPWVEFDSYEAWRGALRCANRAKSHASWVIADLVAYGARQYGAKYKAAIEEFGLSYKRLANMACIARSFEFSRRRENLSFAHHQVLAALSQAHQDEWLAQAEASGLSVAQLKSSLRGTRGLSQRQKASWPEVAISGSRELGGELMVAIESLARIRSDPQAALASLGDADSGRLRSSIGEAKACLAALEAAMNEPVAPPRLTEDEGWYDND